MKIAIALILCSAPVLLSGEDLAEAARREKERRAQQQQSPDARVYSDDDLKAYGSTRAKKDEPTAQSPPRTEPQDDSAARAREEQVWRGRARKLHETVARAEQRVKELEARSNTSYRPYAAVWPGPSILDALDRAKQALEAARKAFADLEEEARRKSVPPGWLRER